MASVFFFLRLAVSLFCEERWNLFDVLKPFVDGAIRERTASHDGAADQSGWGYECCEKKWGPGYYGVKRLLQMLAFR